MPQRAALASRPILTEPNVTRYEWAGATLQRLFGSPRPIAEVWAFFSGPSRPARIASADGLTMADLVRQHPDVLGRLGADPEHAGQKYFFVKFLDPSDFPPFAYVGFRPEAVAALGHPVKPHVAEWLWQDRQALDTLAELIRPHVGSPERFAGFTDAYKRWAIAQADREWSAELPHALEPFALPAKRAELAAALSAQQRARRALTGLMHRLPFRPGEAILVETPTLHAIAGLSLQIHPKTPGNFHPKDELWIYQPVKLPGGGQGWILVEPQRTFDKTESGADFFTPFAWTADGGLGFRKAITRESLEAFVWLMDATPHPEAHFVRHAQPMAIEGARTTDGVLWLRVVEEPGWPYFLVRELRFDGPGEATTPLGHECFIELHATRGRVEVELSAGGGNVARAAVTPTQPLFLPASLPHDTITYRAGGPATLLFFTRR